MTQSDKKEQLTFLQRRFTYLTNALKDMETDSLDYPIFWDQRAEIRRQIIELEKV